MFKRPLPPAIVLSIAIAAAGASAWAQDTAELHAKLHTAESRAALVPVLAALSGGLAALSVGLGWMLYRRRRAEAQAAEDEEDGFDEDTQASVASSLNAPLSTTDDATWAEPRDEPAREPTLEEHIDLDQQVEFLCVLGQDESAIDLLLEHLRSTGGTSPGPYLRLLQIYRDRGDQPAYERTRERFNQRFNALAPEWGADTGAQRGLDAYPDVMAALQRVWSSPLDAMAEIETLLFRRGSEDERFDLPAYEDLLFLYWLTRELQQRAAPQQSKPVDVLLPIEETQAEVSVIQPIQPAKASSRRRPPSPIDLDLSTVPAEPDPDDDPS